VPHHLQKLTAKKRASAATRRANPKRLRVAPEAGPASIAVSRALIVANQKGLGLLSADTALLVVSFLNDSPKSCANWYACNRVRF
jgi:hypothetical protein